VATIVFFLIILSFILTLTRTRYAFPFFQFFFPSHYESDSLLPLYIYKFSLCSAISRTGQSLKYMQSNISDISISKILSKYFLRILHSVSNYQKYVCILYNTLIAMFRCDLIFSMLFRIFSYLHSK